MVDVKDLIRRNNELTGLNAAWRDYFDDIAAFCFPRKAYMNTLRNRGDRLKFNFLYDSTAIRALKTMASGFHSNLTNPSSKWFALETGDQQYMEIREVQTWFRKVDEKIFSTLNNSNFDPVMQEFYMDVGGFGTGGILTLDDPQSIVRFSLAPIGKVNLEEDAQGRICRVYVSFKLSAWAAYRRWGEAAGSKIVECHIDKPGQEFDFLHCVYPREERDAAQDNSSNMPYASVWINVAEAVKIIESGFFENPYAFGRFYKDPTDVMGYSPAMDVLADIKLLNAQQKTMLRAAMKQADPPMQAPSKGYMLPLNFNPAAMNYRDPKTNADALAPIDVGRGNLPITLEIIQMEQKSIEKGFFVHVFRAISDITKQMNNPEVQRIIAESMVELGPVVGRITQETLSPLILRVFSILYRGGHLPEPPSVLAGQNTSNWNVVYLSPLARVQRESEMTSINSFLNTIGAVAAIKPQVLDLIDEDKTIAIIAKIKGVDPEMLRSQEDVDAMRQQRNAAVAAQAQLTAGQQIADVVNTGAQADATMKQAATSHNTPVR